VVLYSSDSELNGVFLCKSYELDNKLKRGQGKIVLKMQLRPQGRWDWEIDTQRASSTF